MSSCTYMYIYTHVYQYYYLPVVFNVYMHANIIICSYRRAKGSAESATAPLREYHIHKWTQSRTHQVSLPTCQPHLRHQQSCHKLTMHHFLFSFFFPAIFYTYRIFFLSKRLYLFMRIMSMRISSVRPRGSFLWYLGGYKILKSLWCRPSKSLLRLRPR